MADNDELNISDFFEDDDTMEVFRAQLEAGGVVASIVDGSGVLVGFSVEKLKEFLKLAEEHEDKILVVLLKSGFEAPDQGELN